MVYHFAKGLINLDGVEEGVLRDPKWGKMCSTSNNVRGYGKRIHVCVGNRRASKRIQEIF